jgi:ABC-type lipoprotein release transport system permease subunit
MNHWLENYKYRININLWLFVVVGIAMFVLTLAVVSLNTLKAATANPVKSLRSE